MMVRPATEADLAAVVALGQVMHAEAPALNDIAFNAEKVERTLRAALDPAYGAVFVHETDGVIDGAFAWALIEFWFSDAEMATDLGLFVRPGRRGGFIAHLLVERFIDWCEGKGVDWMRIGITTGVSPEQTGKFYEREGFQFIGGNYQMRLNGHGVR